MPNQGVSNMIKINKNWIPPVTNQGQGLLKCVCKTKYQNKKVHLS